MNGEMSYSIPRKSHFDVMWMPLWVTNGQKAFHNILWCDLERLSCGGLLRKCPEEEQKSVISASNPSAGMWKVYVLHPGPYFHVAFEIDRVTE